jgi:two-component sensor histidine kinase
MVLLSAWTDGLQSNLLSEFCGLIASIIATYLILDRLIERNRKRHHEPLKRSLHRAVGQNLAALAHLWAFTMDRANGHDLEEALGRELHIVIADLSGRIENELRLLESSAEARATFMERGHVEPDEIARETFEDITGVGEVANRVSQVVLDDIKLEQMLADLAADVRTLDHVRSFAEYLVNVKMDREAPLDLLVVLSIRCYRRTQTVWEYLESLEKGST